MPGLEATVRFAGDTWEMEDHRNWTDASFKTYVRPLALPWPYTLPAGEAVTQSVTVTLGGTARRSGRSAGRETVEVKLGGVAGALLQPLGLGMPPEEIDHALASIDLLRLAAPRFLQCQFDPAPTTDGSRSRATAPCARRLERSACSKSSSAAWKTTRANCNGSPG